MKWSDLTYSKEFCIPFDENQRAIRGYLLTTLDIDLENMPKILLEPFAYVESKKQANIKQIERKIYLSDIIGTSYDDYGGISVIESFMKIKRARRYISQGLVTRGKYFYQLKKPVFDQTVPIILSQTEDGYYFVDGNGNHRIIMYKVMMLAEIAKKYSWACSDDYDFTYKGFHDIRKKYWLKALCNVAPIEP